MGGTSPFVLCKPQVIVSIATAASAGRWIAASEDPPHADEEGDRMSATITVNLLRHILSAYDPEDVIEAIQTGPHEVRLYRVSDGQYIPLQLYQPGQQPSARSKQGCSGCGALIGEWHYPECPKQLKFWGEK
jgi:hypothetical protein